MSTPPVKRKKKDSPTYDAVIIKLKNCGEELTLAALGKIIDPFLIEFDEHKLTGETWLNSVITAVATSDCIEVIGFLYAFDATTLESYEAQQFYKLVLQNLVKSSFTFPSTWGEERQLKQIECYMLTQKPLSGTENQHQMFCISALTAYAIAKTIVLRHEYDKRHELFSPQEIWELLKANGLLRFLVHHVDKLEHSSFAEFENWNNFCNAKFIIDSSLASAFELFGETFDKGLGLEELIPITSSLEQQENSNQKFELVTKNLNIIRRNTVILTNFLEEAKRKREEIKNLMDQEELEIWNQRKRATVLFSSLFGSTAPEADEDLVAAEENPTASPTD